MKKVKLGFVGMMLIAVVAAFATPKPTVTYHKKAVNTTSCLSTTCTPNPGTACSETDMQYFQSNSSGSIPCNSQRVLNLP